MGIYVVGNRIFPRLLCLLLFFVTAPAATEMKGSSGRRGLQSTLSPAEEKMLKKLAKKSMEEPTFPPLEKAAKDLAKVEEKRDKIGTTVDVTVSAPSSVPTPLNLPLLSPQAVFAPLPSSMNYPSQQPTSAVLNKSTSWSFLLETTPPIPRQILQDALTEYFGPYASLTNNGGVFVVESHYHKASDHQRKVFDRKGLQEYLRQTLRRQELVVTTLVAEINSESVTVRSPNQPKKTWLVMFIVSLFTIGLALVGILYVFPYLQLRREYEQEWTFSEEREARILQASSA